MPATPLNQKLWKRQRGLCWLCTEPMLEWPRNHPLAWSFDHIQPLNACGANRPGNKLLAHRDCNNVRGHAMVIPQGVSLARFIQKQYSKLDVADKRKERFRSMQLQLTEPESR